MARSPRPIESVCGSAGAHRWPARTVVKEYRHFWLIEKHAEAGDVAEELA